MKKFYLKSISSFVFTLFLCGAIAPVFAQEASPLEEPIFSEFEGKFKARVFTDFSQGLFDNREVTGFNIKRAVFGYEAFFGKGLSADLEIDFASTETDTGEAEYATYVRNAELIWDVNNFQFNFGVITPMIFNYVENFWGFRYAVKSAMDEYGFGNSRDLGFAAKYKPSSKLSLDLSILNGDGYKFFETDNNLKYGIGATFEPLDGLWMRLYGEIYGDNNSVVDGKSQQIISGFLGYKRPNYSFGVEYDYMWNTEFIDGEDQSIISIYGRYKFTQNYSIYARYDNIQSRNNWNGYEEAYYLGFQFHPIKYVNIAPMFTYKKNLGENGLPSIGLFVELKY